VLEFFRPCGYLCSLLCPVDWAWSCLSGSFWPQAALPHQQTGSILPSVLLDVVLPPDPGIPTEGVTASLPYVWTGHKALTQPRTLR
jgi:hypothetical protein